MAQGAQNMPVGEIVRVPKKVVFDWTRIFFISLGLAFFFVFYFMSNLPDAVDPAGKHFPLPSQGKMAIGLFLMAAVWWIFEVMPIGATAIAIGLFQVVFMIRTADAALKDFFDPSVWFIFGSVVMGLAFAHSGLTRRMAYK
ncbi:MAG: SLC13/DASS family transporter, partial [Syntrophobacteraceae bacterium]|nr:SLC13/DASS family transporter [Syntrophobacteraceae bacterium]